MLSWKSPLLSGSLILACLGGLSACGGGKSERPADPRFNGFPSPASLLREVEATGGRGKDGDAFSGLIPAQNVTANGDSAVFTPVPGSGSELDSSAYALYRFDLGGRDIEDVDVGVRFHWAAFPPGGFYFGLADFANNRWVFTEGDQDLTQLPPDPVHTYADDVFLNNMFVIVIVLGSGQGVLDRLSIGNLPPRPDLGSSTSSGDAPLEVTFSAIDSSDPDFDLPLTFEWDYDGDGTIDESTGTSSVGVFTYDEAGHYEATLFAIDALGARDDLSMTINVENNGNELPIAILDEVPATGTRPLQQFINASNSFDNDGSIVKYEWDLDGDEAYELDSGLQPSQTPTFVSPGVHNFGVRVTDDDGGQDIARGSIELSGSWQTQTLGTVGGGHSDVSLAFGNKVFLAFCDESANKLFLSTLPANAFPQDQWSAPIEIPCNPPIKRSPQLLMLSGGPGIAYISTDNNDLYFMASLDQDGANWPASANLAAESSSDFSLGIINGKPAIAFRKVQMVGGPLCLVTAGSSDGNGWGGELTLDGTGAFSTPSLATNVQIPCVSYFKSGANIQYFVRATSQTGETWKDPVVVDDTLAVQAGGVLLSSGLSPLVLYNAENRTRALQATDAAGDSWVTPATIVNDEFASSPLAAQRPLGLPALARVVSSGELQYLLAQDTEGGSWNEPEIIDINASGLRPALLQTGPYTYCAYFSSDLEVKVAAFF